MYMDVKIKLNGKLIIDSVNQDIRCFWTSASTNYFSGCVCS